MAKGKSGTDDSGDEDRGCAFVLGLFIVAICIGSIYGASAGWLVVGVTLLAIALLQL